MEKFNTENLRKNQEELKKILEESKDTFNEEDLNKLLDSLKKEIEVTDKLEKFYNEYKDKKF